MQDPSSDAGGGPAETPLAALPSMAQLESVFDCESMARFPTKIRTTFAPATAGVVK
jgi:hypothetical protein